jgi:hypothetical protein
VVFLELLGTLYASFLFMNIILLFRLTCRNLLVKSLQGDDLKSLLYGNVSEKPMMGMFDPFFYRYTIFRANDRNICRERLGHRIRMILNSGSLLFLLVRAYRSCVHIIKLPN